MEELRTATGQTQKKKEEPKGFAGLVYSLLHDMLYVLVGVVVLFVFFARLTGVHGSSMNPTLYGVEDSGRGSGDYLILLSNVIYSDYQRGDIVVACTPSFENGKPIVKRVIATPGQTVDLHYDENGVYRVYVDGVALDEPYINGEMFETRYTTISFPATVPENCYFLMGDNRNNSTDSREPRVGMVDRQYIVGKALTIILPGGENGRDWTRLLKLG